MNKFLFIKFIASMLSIILIALGIIYTKMDFPFAIFFLIPLVVYSIQKGTHYIQIIILSFFASLIWTLTYCLLESVVLDFTILLNASLRFGIYLSLSFMLFLLVKQRTELVKKNIELEELNLEKNRILGIASHDIRNAASAVNSFSDILLEKLKTQGQLLNEIRIASIINSASSHLVDLVSNILDLSKIESGQIQLNKNPTDYNSFIENRIELLQIIAQQKNIKIIFKKTPDLKPINFDSVYLVEVIDNLISNAIKYSNSESEIHVRLHVVNNWIRTEIIDSGLGINSTELDGLFMPFYRTSNRPTGSEKSSGLGLAIAKKIITLHGGEIGVKSIIHEGSTFYFTLPL